MSTEDIYNYRKVDERVITGGQPTEGQLRSAADEGVQVVIDLATLDPRSTLPDEDRLVRSLAMEYRHIPVNWDAPAAADFDAFVGQMEKSSDRRVLIHCAANYRVTAFYSLYAMQKLGWSEEQAAAFRAPTWQRTYPVWDAFIQAMQARIQSNQQAGQP